MFRPSTRNTFFFANIILRTLDCENVESPPPPVALLDGYNDETNYV